VITYEEANARALKNDFSGMEEWARPEVAAEPETHTTALVTPSVITVPADIERQVRVVLEDTTLTPKQKAAFLGTNFLPSEEGHAILMEILEERASGSVLPSGAWEPQDLEDVLDGSYSPPQPNFFLRTDDVGLFYPGVVNEIHMEAGGGKTWVALALVSERLRLGERVLYIDHEEHRGRVVSRLLSLGLTPDMIRAGFDYLQPESAPTDADLTKLTCAGYDLVVVDTVGESIRLVTGGDSNSTDDVTDWHAFTRAFARAGACVLVIDHITKSADNPLFPIGSQAKYAGYKGAVYLMEAPKGGGLATGASGFLTLKLAKDNGGGLGLHKGDLAAEFHLDSTVPSQALWELRAPDASTQVARAAHTRMIQRQEVLEAVPAEGISKSKLRDALGLKGNNFGPYAELVSGMIEHGEFIEDPSSRSIGTGELGKVEAPSLTFPGEPGKVANPVSYPVNATREEWS
jgi:AAA domain